MISDDRIVWLPREAVPYECSACEDGKAVVYVGDGCDEAVWLCRACVAKLAALLDKYERRQKEVKIDYLGFQIPDEFVVGYGLDFAERYRNLPFIAVLKDPSA